MLSYFLSVLESNEDRRVFAEIYEKYHTKMEKTAIYILKNQEDAEDAMQNAFMRVIKHFDKAISIPCEELQFWLISIVKNEALMIIRKKRKVVSLEDNADIPANIIEDVHSYNDLVGVFSKLPEIYRAVLEMKVFIGYTDKEIAEILGISETAVSTRASRGREILRKIAGQEGFHI